MTADFQQQLLEALVVPSSDAGNGSKMEDLLLQLGNADPKVKLIAQYLAQRQAQELGGEPDPDDDTGWEATEDDDESNVAALRVGKRARSWPRLRRLVESMYAELEVLRERNDVLAAALGACYLCWGEDLDCELCHGAGRPGSSAPDRALFAQLVVPAARRLRAGRDVKRTSKHTDPSAFDRRMKASERRPSETSDLEQHFSNTV